MYQLLSPPEVFMSVFISELLGDKISPLKIVKISLVSLVFPLNFPFFKSSLVKIDADM